jgi:hypothetical protein
MSWHASSGQLDGYAAGGLPGALAWSVEAHLAVCGTCRDRLDRAPAATAPATGVEDERLAALWAQIDSASRAVERPLVERVLVRVGLAEHDARLLAATPSLTASWLVGVALVVALGVATAWASPASGPSAFWFLLLAPLVPVGGVAVAFGPGVDPTYQVGVVAPMPSWRLLLVRCVAVLGASLALLATGAATLPAAGWTAVAWLLPSLALAAAVLAASTRWAPAPSAVVIGGSWVVLVFVLETQVAGRLVAFGSAGQILMAALLCASLVRFVACRDRLETAVRL